MVGYKKRGYISSEDENESVSKTLEYAYNDWCIAEMARIIFQRRVDLHHISPATLVYRDEGVRYAGRARYFENLFDPRVDFFVPRKNGGFIRPFAPNEVTFHFTEGNSWQYSFFVPHDISRLIELHGGREYFGGKLLKLFTTEQKLTGREQPDITGLIGQYAHGNEPSHHIPYLFNYAGMPWRTQMYVRKIMDEFYKNSPDGLIGNEDCGQMSAWFVLSASGFYPVTPGSPEYAIGTPLFPEVKFNLENGRTFTVRATNLSDKNFYVRSLSFNGKRLTIPTLGHEDIMSGGLLTFDMNDAASTSAFAEPARIGHSERTVAAPWIDYSSTIFMGTATKGTKIYYTLDGTDPGERSELYVVPFKLRDRPAPPRIRAIAIDRYGTKSPIVESRAYKRPNDWTVKILSPYSTQYNRWRGPRDH